MRVGPDFGPTRYASTFAALQWRSSAALLDLSPARTLCADVFEHIAEAWAVSPETVPRLGIVLSFERWVLLRVEALTALQPIATRGTRVDILYEEQSRHLGESPAGGDVAHNVAAVVATLTARWQLAPRWRPPLSWPGVLDTLVRLVRIDAGAVALPALLIDLADLSLSCGDAVRAVALAREALYSLPEQSRARRSNALCELGTALIEQGEIATGLHMLDEATAIAAAITEPAIGASSLFQSGLYALRVGDDPGAERRFRGALELLSASDRRPRLRALVHHHLAIALMNLGKPGAAHHASIALALRPDLGGSLGEANPSLLEKLNNGATDPPTDRRTVAVPESPPASEVKV